MWVLAASVLLAAAAAPAAAATVPTYGEYFEPANYAFQYAVKDDYAGLDFKAGKG